MDIQQTFPDDPIVLNIELGAGCGDFGKKFYFPCYLTELQKPTCEKSFIDHICDAHCLPWTKDRFITIIACNPFGYGFNTEESTTKLMDEISRVIITAGEFLVISSSTNRWGSIRVINREITKYQIKNPHLKISVTQKINTNADIIATFPNYQFYQSDQKTTATPNELTVIKISK
jgi:ubiquinone/menaquinone biosynthesis C-methylase UbiE